MENFNFILNYLGLSKSSSNCLENCSFEDPVTLSNDKIKQDDSFHLVNKTNIELNPYEYKFNNGLEEINKTLNQNRIFSFDFNYQDFINSLDPIEMLAFSGLLLNSLVLNSTISIILILYGEYLIKRFNLENRFPKIAKFIQIRSKLQNFFLKVNIFWIFIGVLPPMFMYAYILGNKLIGILI